LPPRAPLLCPAEAAGPVAPEPLPPAGVSASKMHDALVGAFGDLGDDLFRWISVDHPAWARINANRLETVGAFCKKLEAPGT
jgi:hypothetical protein